MRNWDKADWKKLRRLLGYLKLTIKLPLILCADGVNVIKWWLDVSYATHDNMQGTHWRNYVNGENRRGSIIIISKKQKLNTKSLTEEELIGADNAMPHMLWTMYFMDAQGYGIENNISYQDNMNKILLPKNMKHINVC